MRITFITPQPPEQFGGGGMIVYAHLLALSQILGVNNLQYLGPQSKSIDIFSLVKSAYFVPKVNHLDKLRSVLNQKDYTTLGIYFDENKQDLIKVISEFSKVAWVEFTKTGFLVDSLRTCGIKVLCYAHNYEKDYYKISEKNLYRIFKNAIIKNEILSLRASTILGDESYLQQILKNYGDKHNYKHLPFYSFREHTNPSSKNKVAISSIVLSGSFSFGHNFKTLKYILDVWEKLHSREIYLSLCGSGLDRITSYLKRIPNLIIYNKPYDEYPIIECSKIYLNPFISNAGVLTRNLVAMSASIPVIGLTESFKGYSLDNMRDVIMCNSIDEIMKNALQTVKDEQVLEFLSNNITMTFNKKYSLSCGKHNITSILQTLN